MTIRLMSGSPCSETQNCQSVFFPRKARCRHGVPPMTPRPTMKPEVTFARAVRREVVAQQRGERRGEAELVLHRAEEIVELFRRRPAGVDVFPSVQQREGLPVVPAAGGPLLALEHVPEAVRATDGDLERPGELDLLARGQRGVVRHFGAEGEALRPADALQGRLEDPGGLGLDRWLLLRAGHRRRSGMAASARPAARSAPVIPCSQHRLLLIRAPPAFQRDRARDGADPGADACLIQVRRGRLSSRLPGSPGGRPLWCGRPRRV